MLHTHLANRPDALVAALAALQRVDPLPLSEPETVVVPSMALARWLDFRLADALGIAMHNAFVFPAVYVWQLFGRVLPEVAASSPFDRAAMQWRLLRLLGDSRAPEIRHYLDGDDGMRRFELAGQIAALFDRYLVERPDWIEAWSAGRPLGLGPDETWQAPLWRALLDEIPKVAREHPRERFLATLRAQPALRARLPRRLSLFCVEAMPALYWDVFVALSEWMDLHVFVLAPCREYWGDVERMRERLRLEIEQPDAAVLYETGHPLLASLGRARQHATVRLADAAAQLASTEHAYFAQTPESLLGRVQCDILELKVGQGISPDATLQIHDGHGVQREAEVLLDRLLERFEALSDLHPSDILILTPDIETYGPVIAAVLGNAPGSRRIPCTVADRPRAMLPLWRALRQLCDVAAGELDAESVLALLDEPALRHAFAIDEAELPHLRDWVAAAGIRWDVDAASRARRGLPADDAHTWRAGLRRLLLGVALPDEPERLWQGMLAMPGIEGERAELLGRFIDFAEALFDLAEQINAERVAMQWCRLLTMCLDRFFTPATEGDETEMQRLRTALRQIDALAKETGCTVQLPLSALLRELDGRLAEQVSAQAFVSGAATIAALQPARPIAARVICLVGMNDGAWPRPALPVSFDLVAVHPRSGDRNRRAEERHAFLEALLCAADALIITYTGRDPRSNLTLPPAAPLAELLDTLKAMTGLPADKIVIKHPLQPFSSDYFSGVAERLFSFDAEHCSVPTHREVHAFCASRALLHDAGRMDVELAELRRFFANPVRYFLRERLGIHLEESGAPLATHEPFILNNLEAYRLREAQFGAMLAGQGAEEVETLLRARGWLPQGIAGGLAVRTARAQVLSLWKRTQPWREALHQPDSTVSLDVAGLRLNGRLDGLTDRGLWRIRYGRLRARDRLHLWLDHLLLNIVAPPGVPLVSTLLTLDDTLVFHHEPAAAEILADLLALYREGAACALSFYPETAYAWQTQNKWRREWEGDRHRGKPGERDDAYIQLVLRDREDDPLGPAFQQLAERVFAPMMNGVGDD